MFFAIKIAVSNAMAVLTGSVTNAGVVADTQETVGDQPSSLATIRKIRYSWRTAMATALQPLGAPLIERQTGARNEVVPSYTLTDARQDLLSICASVRKAGFCGARVQLHTTFRRWLAETTEESFIRSEVNGRQSRRVVLLVFFISDTIGAVSWAMWCSQHTRTAGGSMPSSRACDSLGVNRFFALSAALPFEGVVLFLAGWWLWSFWSDFLLLPTLLLRLLVFDVFLWGTPATMMFTDILWFVVVAVMCRVHSGALAILIVVMIVAMTITLQLDSPDTLRTSDYEEARIGHYSLYALILVALAYFLDEQRRLRAHSNLLMLQDKNSALAEHLIRWKVLVGDIETGSVELSNPDLGRRPITDCSSALTEQPLARHFSEGTQHADGWSDLSREHARLVPQAKQHPRLALGAAKYPFQHLEDAVHTMEHGQQEWPDWRILAPTTRPRLQPTSVPQAIRDPQSYHTWAPNRQLSPGMDILDVLE